MDERFARQVILPEVGEEGQRRLANSHVLVVGCGALGSHTAEALARAGVGRLTLVDRDVLEVHNLHRVGLMAPQDLGQSKAVLCANALRHIAPQIRLHAEVVDFGPEQASAWVPEVDLVADGLDNLETRYLLNDACVKYGVPWNYTAVLATHGMSMPILPGKGPCLRCLFPEPPPTGSLPTCATAGILGPVPMALAALQAAAALRILVQPEMAMEATLIQCDLWGRSIDQVPVERAQGCPTCGRRDFVFLDGRPQDTGS